MDRFEAYALLSAELDRWRTLPRSDVIARLGAPPSMTSAMIGGEMISIEVTISWADTRRKKLRVQATALGPSHWKMERLDEAMLLEPLDLADPGSSAKT